MTPHPSTAQAPTAGAYWRKVEASGMAHEFTPETLVTRAYIDGAADERARLGKLVEERIEEYLSSEGYSIGHLLHDLRVMFAPDAQPNKEGAHSYIFFRNDGWYVLDLNNDEDACANAKCNPGTLRVEAAYTGRTVWTLQQPNKEGAQP